MPLTTLNLTIRTLADGTRSVDMELRSDQSVATSRLAAQRPLVLDTVALLALHSDSDAYGRLLAAQLFADEMLREAWLQARAYAATGDLQLRLHLDPSDPALHAIRWETLSDPQTGQPIALQQRVRLVRTLDSSDLTPVRLAPRPDLWALVLVSNPSDLGRFNLAEVDVEGEVARTRAALGDIPLRLLADHPEAVGRATLANLLTHLGDAPPLVLLIAHGSLRKSQPLLWLEQDDGTAHPVDGAVVVDGVARLSVRPLLLALLSCQSAGRGYTDTLQALGPALAQIGVPAVLGFQDNVAMSVVKVLLPALIREVRRDGQIDRAMAAARTALGANQPWWQATLWLRTDGRLWEIPTAVPLPHTQRQELDNRAKLLSLVQKFWIEGVLHASLHQRVLIELGVQTVSDALYQPWQQIVSLPGQPPQQLDSHTSIAGIFAQASQQLLILGAPGGGKTTTLLMLAEQLIAAAQSDPNRPIPVIFQLSTWALSKPKLADWLVTEMKERYKVPPKIGRAWVECGAILPLLDGLDEVGPTDAERAACVQAINAYLGESGAPAIVCSRSVEYAQLHAKLALEAAIEIQPLTLAQADAFLARFGSPLAGVRQAIATDASLAELAHSPLLLSVMTLAYADIPAAALVNQSDQIATRRLWTDYVARRLSLKRADTQIDPVRLRTWLAWLARGMQVHGQQVFYIEYLQPSWLASKGQRRLFHVLTSLVSGLLFGMEIGLLLGILFGVSIGFGVDPIGNIILGVIIGMLFGISIGIFSGFIIGLRSKQNSITLTETLAWNWRQAFSWQRLSPYIRDGLYGGLRGGLIIGLIFGLILSLDGSLLINMVTGLVVGILLGVIGGLGVGVGVAPILAVLESSEIQISTRPNEGMHRSLSSAWRGSLVGGLGLGFVFSIIFGLGGGLFGGGEGLLGGLLSGFIFGLSGGLGAGFFQYGGTAVIKHYILRWLLRWRCGVPADVVATLDESVSRTLMTRVGGGYRFYHRMLQEHFAEHESPELPVATIIGPQNEAERGGRRVHAD